MKSLPDFHHNHRTFKKPRFFKKDPVSLIWKIAHVRLYNTMEMKSNADHIKMETS